MSLLSSAEFWIALSQIILINIVLSGDNAVVIAMASRSLPPAQQKKAILFGSVGAIVLRVVLTFFAVYLLTLPYLKLVGAALLLWIGIGLLQEEDEGKSMEGHAGLAAAIKTIVVADLVMSLDNVVGVAAAAKGNVPLLVFGLVISIPLIIFGSTLILKLMDRFPIIIVLGAALLGWVAGEMAMTDPSIVGLAANQHALHTVVPALGAMFVVAIGKWLSTRRGQRREQQLQATKKQPAV
ncbi:TerC family protein [Variovorax sp. LjRoot84]|uniref:TerC family protein n=1 Tax=unclassified Variovorax TaxID=663243 RepID=UPI0008880E1D|nr:TerC family protein [Variovorax sp. CF079]SDC81978.1 integral membrane protein, YjbE family [Variovorax sp. CF079]